MPLQAGCSPIAPEQSTGAESIDCPRQGKAVKHTQHPPRKSSQEQKGTGAETGVETRLQHGSKIYPGGIAKDMVEWMLQGGTIQVSGCVQLHLMLVWDTGTGLELLHSGG